MKRQGAAHAKVAAESGFRSPRQTELPLRGHSLAMVAQQLLAVVLGISPAASGRPATAGLRGSCGRGSRDQVAQRADEQRLDLRARRLTGHPGERRLGGEGVEGAQRQPGRGRVGEDVAVDLQRALDAALRRPARRSRGSRGSARVGGRGRRRPATSRGWRRRRPAPRRCCAPGARPAASRARRCARSASAAAPSADDREEDAADAVEVVVHERSGDAGGLRDVGGRDACRRGARRTARGRPATIVAGGGASGARRRAAHGGHAARA